MKDYFANGLSLLRILIVPAVVVLALMESWHMALNVLTAGWATSLLGSQLSRRFTFDIGFLADSWLAIASGAVIVVYYAGTRGNDPATITVSGIFLLTIMANSWLAVVLARPQSHQNRKLLATLEAIRYYIQILAVIGWFAFMAYGRIGAEVVGVVTLASITTQVNKVTGRLRPKE